MTQYLLRSSRFAMASLTTILGLILMGCSANNAGIASSDAISSVVYQECDPSLPMQPEPWPIDLPRCTTDRSAINAFYEAINHPSGGPAKTLPTHRLGFISRDGSVAVYPVNGYVEGCKSCYANLSDAEKLAFTGNSDKHSCPFVKAESVSRIYYRTGEMVESAYPANHLLEQVARSWRDLIGAFSPFSLKGNELCTASDLQVVIKRTPQYVKIVLASPIHFDAIVLSEGAEWPPKAEYASGQVKQVTCDTVYALRVADDPQRSIRFAFLNTRSKQCLLTGAILPRIKSYSKSAGRAAFGPDLLDEMLSHIRK